MVQGVGFEEDVIDLGCQLLELALKCKCSPWYGEWHPQDLCLERKDSFLCVSVSGCHREAGALG